MAAMAAAAIPFVVLGIVTRAGRRRPCEGPASTASRGDAAGGRGRQDPTDYEI
jgi:hypothetical protein